MRQCTRDILTAITASALPLAIAHAEMTEQELSAFIQQAAAQATAETIEEEQAQSNQQQRNPRVDDFKVGPAFAEEGYTSLDIEFAVAVTENNEDYQLRVGYSHFLADDFQISYGLSAWYHDQEIDNQGSVSFDFAFRYHFLKQDTEPGISPDWTIYADIGIGVMGSTGEVPDLGTEFNFIPRAGAGVTFAPFKDSATRFNLGLRWHHISNGSTFGSDENPDRDALMLFTGIIIPL